MRLIDVRWLIIFLLVLIANTWLRSQNCGLRDTIIFGLNSTANIDLTISDYFNDDLSDPLQGLCGVELGFVHQAVENFELSLTSPAGQTINLIGPNSDDNDFTLGTVWDIDFVNCATMAEPDSAFAAVWDNEQSENWVSFQLYDGTYYPFNGCLEDFNTGPVNGTWTLNITNTPSNSPGAITYVRLIFCDSRGVECCFTQPGIWENEDILACTAADTLLIQPQLDFPVGPADTTEYSYAFLIGENGIYQELDSLLDLRDFPAGNYEICGFSYRRVDLDSLPLPDGSLTLDSIRTNLDGLEPWLCAQLTPSCLNVVIQAPPDTLRLNESICRGDSVVLGEQTFMDSGVYTVDLLTAAGCDSTITLDLFVQEVQLTQIDTIICPEDTVFVGNMPYFETGFYRDTLSTVALGCDSIVELNLFVLAQQVTQIDTVLCAGSQLIVGDSVLQQAGNYQILLTSSQGCDSLVSVDLTLLDPVANITGSDLINCATPTTILDGNTSQPTGLLSYAWQTLAGVPLGTAPTLVVATQGNYELLVTQSLAGTTCTARDTFFVTENFATPTADPGLPDSLDCNVFAVTIGGTGSSTGPGFSYSWSTTDGNITGPSNTVITTANAVGAYQLIIENNNSFCRDTAVVNVVSNAINPDVLPGTSFELNCQVTADTLDGSASLAPNRTAVWDGPCIIETLSNARVVVDCAGWYYLTITDTNNGCSATDSVLVTENQIPPAAVVALPNTLNCGVPNILLDATNSTPPGLLTFAWQGPETGLPNSPTVTVSTPGDYRLFITRTDNFCADTVLVTVVQDTLAPTADAGPDVLLTCLQESVLTGGVSSQGNAITYQWSSEGIPLAGAVNDSLLVTEEGTFVLTVTNTLNQCIDHDTIQVLSDFLPPENVEAGPFTLLDCAGSIVQLQPDSTGFSRPVSFAWTSDCLSEPSTDHWALQTDCPGTYYLNVTNIDNGCSAQDSTQVNTSANFSQAFLPDTTYLSCENGTAVLDSTGSIGVLFRWFRDGVEISLPIAPPTINAPGIYQLEASDLTGECTDTATTIVLADCNLTAIAEASSPITCAIPLVTLSGENSMGDGPFTYSWTGPTGCILGDTNQTTIDVACNGTYELILSHELFDLQDTVQIEVGIDTISPQINAGPNQTILCGDDCVTLQGSVQGNPLDFAYAWTSFFVPDDTLAQTPNYCATAAGTYLFAVENLSNGCISTDVVQVALDNVPPSIAFGSPVYPCAADSFRLEAFVSLPNDDYIYQWTGPGIISDADGVNVWINALGTYTLTVNNPNNNCSESENVIVVEQSCAPCLELATLDTITCGTPSLLLTAELCLPCNNCTYAWTNLAGDVLGNGLSLSVSEADIYTLTATGEDGLTSSASTQVIELTAAPPVALGPDRVLSCDSTSIVLRYPLPADELVLRWEQLGTGLLTTMADTLLVDEISTYVLTVTDPLTLCMGTDTVTVTELLTEPQAEAGPDQQLTCGSNFVQLDGQASTLSGVAYAWSGPNTSCLSGAMTTTPLATCAGLYTLVVTDNASGCSSQDTVRVSLNEDVPELLSFPDTVLTCATQAITLVGGVTSMGNFDLSWCPLDEQGNELTNECVPLTTLTVNTVGTYRFTATNQMTDCSNSFVVTVGIDTLPPAIDAGIADTLYCDLTALSLVANAPADALYQWTNVASLSIDDATSLTPTVFAPGWYVLSVTDNGNGCTAVDSVQVFTDEAAPSLTLAEEATLTCVQPSLILMADGTTQNGSPLWQWTTDTGNFISGTDGPMPIIDAAGWYWVTLTDDGNNCQIMDSIFVEANTTPPVATLLPVGELILNCYTDTLQLDASNSQDATGQGLTYEWQATPPGVLFPNLTAPQVRTDRAGNYTLIVTDQGNSCADTIEFSIAADFELPDLELAPVDSLTCFENNVVLSTLVPNDPAGFSFIWVSPAGDTLSSDPTGLTTLGGWHYLTLTDLDNGCSRLDSIYVPTVNDVPVVNIATPLPLTCSRLSTTLDASASGQNTAFVYEWFTGLGNITGPVDQRITTADATGWYYLLIRNTLTGCEAIDSVLVAQQGTPITGIDFTVEPPACVGETIGAISVDGVFGGSPPYTYQLNDQLPGPQSFFEDLAPGNYTVQITDTEGCIWTELAFLPEPTALLLDLGPDAVLPLGDSLQLAPQSSRPVADWEWESAGLIAPNGPYAPVVYPQRTEFLILAITDSLGCTASDTLLITVERELGVYIPNVFSPDGIGENERFTIYAGSEVAEIVSLRIFSRWGNMVFERQNFAPNDPNLGWDGTLWGQALNTGVYVYYAEIRMQDGELRLVTGDLVLMK